MRVFLSLVLTMALTIGYAQQTDAMLFGDAKDAETGEHIPFVNITINGTTIGTATDATGHFKLTNLPVGKITVIASSLGYKTVSKQVVMKANKSTEIYFKLKQDAIMTDQVVVSANRNAISREKAPVIVSALTPKHMEAIESISVADGLNFTPGLRVEANCQNCGFTQLRMNGLEGAYSQILVNSRAVFSGLAGVYGLEQIPAEMVERIEVIRGGGSALFGSNAIAGTVNIITKDPIDNCFQAGIKGEMIGVGAKEAGDVAYGKSTNFNGSVVSDNRKAGIFVFGLHRERDQWDANNDGFTEVVKLKNTSAGFQGFLKPTDRSRIGIEYHNLTEYRRGGDRLYLLPHASDIAEMLKHNNNSGGITYELFTNQETHDKLSVYASAQHVERESYYGAEQDPTAYGYTTGLTSIAGVQYSKNVKRFLGAAGNLTAGIENHNDRINDNKLNPDPTFGKINVTNQSSNTIGAYAQYQLDYSMFKFLLGARVDHYDVQDIAKKIKGEKGTVFSPRANVLFDLTENMQLRASYSTGFRAPQIFDEDLHIETSGARRIEHKNSENLKQEKSQSFSGSFRYKNQFGKWNVEFLAEGFYTQLTDPFVVEFETPDSTGTAYAVRANGDEAHIYGANLELTLAPSRKFYAQLGGTVQKSQYTEALGWGDDETKADVHVTKEILRTPGSYAYAIINYEPTKKWSFSLSGNYTGSMFVPHLAGGNDKAGVEITEENLVKTKSFVDVNLKGSYTVRLMKATYLELSAGVKNIFNSYQNDFDYGIGRDAGYIYGPRMPRVIFAGIKVNM